MPSNTTFNPLRTSDFERPKLNFDAKSASATVSAGTTQNIDLQMTDDCLLTGGWLIVDGAKLGDTVSFQVVDATGAFSGTPGTVIAQYVSGWCVPKTCDTHIDMVYPAKIYTSLILRVAYTSTGTENVFVAINYKLHKVLE